MYKNADNFLRCNNFHQYETRRCDNILTPAYSTLTFQKTPHYMGIKLCNMLILEIRQINNPEEFNKRIQEYLEYI